ncbi:MAG: XRE family transcriptional regulator [Myxococcales bacterium]|nr:XRE family transcriptional regulator [Myxococcales bacterium]
MDKHKNPDADGGALHATLAPEGVARASGPASEPAKEVLKAADRAPEKAEKTARANGPKRTKNNVRKMRTEKMMSKAELARRAGMSTLTIDRVERGLPCRMDTKRKILEALGLKPTDRVAVFGDQGEPGDLDDQGDFGDPGD